MGAAGRGGGGGGIVGGGEGRGGGGLGGLWIDDGWEGILRPNSIPVYTFRLTHPFEDRDSDWRLWVKEIESYNPAESARQVHLWWKTGFALSRVL